MIVSYAECLAVTLPQKPGNADLEWVEIVYYWARQTAVSRMIDVQEPLDAIELDERLQSVLQKLDTDEAMRRKISNASR